MDTSGFLLIVLTGIIVIALSYILDHFWAAALPVRGIYYFIRAPGVVIHECTHIVGCLITGAGIHKVVFFSKDGGSVTHTPPRILYLGDVIISTAPLFGIPMVLSAVTWIFAAYCGCTFPAFPEYLDNPDTLRIIGELISTTFAANLVTRFNPWFLLYLYLTVSLVLSAAPSAQDMKNAAAGVLLLTLAGFGILVSGIPVAEYLLDQTMRLLGIGFTLGLVYGLIALAVTLPLVFWYAVAHRG